VKIILAINEWVALRSNNTCTLRLFISSIPSFTSDATLTYSYVRWKTLPKVRSFYALSPLNRSLPFIEKISPTYSQWLIVDGSDSAAYGSVPVSVPVGALLLIMTSFATIMTPLPQLLVVSPFMTLPSAYKA